MWSFCRRRVSELFGSCDIDSNDDDMLLLFNLDQSCATMMEDKCAFPSLEAERRAVGESCFV